jgi:ATP-dependent RNA helicase SUPV3L1/SUV3
MVNEPFVRPKDRSKPKAAPLSPPTDEGLPDAVADLLSRRISVWKKQDGVHKLLETFGVPSREVPAATAAFGAAADARTALPPDIWDAGRLRHLWEDLSGLEDPVVIDRALTRAFYAWAADDAGTTALRAAGVAAPTVERMRDLSRAGDLSYPHERYDGARRMRRRFIMHVGPTNSGKTHHALRALAAARTGVYAGPLRLLAHEIWERLNQGQIIPAGVDPAELPPAEPAPDSNFDVADPTGARPAVRATGDPRFARQCNMVTGEEIKVVAENAPLVSCTVEMVSSTRKFHVAVIDEIQLLGDDQRGGAWAAAVLGVCAEEVHLCGEETAVPIVQAMLADTGDSLEIRRYERLTPLRVADKSLEGDLGRVQKGDCVVAFSRTAIFRIRDEIEEKTGLRCAVAYGALPPEVRSEQAALFNDPNSGYDVLVGSDAVGMGLNLFVSLLARAYTPPDVRPGRSSVLCFTRLSSSTACASARSVSRKSSKSLAVRVASGCTRTPRRAVSR